MAEEQTVASLQAEVASLTAEISRRDHILGSVANDDAERAIELIQDGTPWDVVWSWRHNAWQPLDGMGLIQAERKRQIEVEGWSLARDVALYSGDRAGELERAADCYREADEQHPRPGPDEVPEGWPWDADWWKPGDGSPAGAVRDLTKAGALYLAQAEVYEAQGNTESARDCRWQSREMAEEIDLLLKEMADV
jgi:tetratricopeptide (TPR) repeat protein